MKHSRSHKDISKYASQQACYADNKPHDKTKNIFDSLFRVSISSASQCINK